jgi:hypothetical protein
MGHELKDPTMFILDVLTHKLISVSRCRLFHHMQLGWLLIRLRPCFSWRWCWWLFTYRNNCKCAVGCYSIVLGQIHNHIPKRVLHRVRPSASSFNFQYSLFSLRSSSSCLTLVPHLLVTSALPSIFSAVTCFRKQFLHNMPPIQLAVLPLSEFVTLAENGQCSSSNRIQSQLTKFLCNGIYQGTKRNSRFESRWGARFLHLSRPAVGPAKPPIQWVPVLSPWLKRPVRGFNQPPSSSAEVK